VTMSSPSSSTSEKLYASVAALIDGAGSRAGAAETAEDVTST